MWDKINKVQAQVIACMIIILGCFSLAVFGAIYGFPDSAKDYINKITDISLTGTIGWLFMMAKNGAFDKNKPLQ